MVNASTWRCTQCIYLMPQVEDVLKKKLKKLVLRESRSLQVLWVSYLMSITTTQLSLLKRDWSLTSSLIRYSLRRKLQESMVQLKIARVKITSQTLDMTKKKVLMHSLIKLIFHTET